MYMAAEGASSSAHLEEATKIDGTGFEETYVDFLPQPLHAASSIITLPFNDRLKQPLRLQTNQSECGGQLWPAGKVLGQYLLDHVLFPSSQAYDVPSILELGAGSGLVGLAVASAFKQQHLPNLQAHDDNSSTLTSTSTSQVATPSSFEQSASANVNQTPHILVTDGLAVLIPLIEQNIALNELDPAIVQAAHLCWGINSFNYAAVHPTQQAYPDLILVADCAYLEETFPLLAETLDDTMGPETVLWFCYKKRRRRDRDCIKIIRKRLSPVDVSIVTGPWEREQDVWLYRLQRKG